MVDTNIIWNKMANPIIKIVKEVLGEFKRRYLGSKESWWWDQEVQKTVETKRIWYDIWQNCRNIKNLEKYKEVRKSAKKKTISDAKHRAYVTLYTRLDTKKGEKDIYKLARVRERKCKDLGDVKCIKDHQPTPKPSLSPTKWG